MSPSRGDAAENPTTRTALLDAAEKIMMDEGYAAVSSRRLGTAVGVNPALVYYYFENMDNLFIELFRRGADRSYQTQIDALAAPQPLWSLWEAIHDRSHTALTMEFVALANHRKAIRAEISDSSRKFRKLQLDAVAKILDGYGVRDETRTPETIVLTMSSISRFLRIEEAFDVDAGHRQVINLVEIFLRELEGERQAPDPPR
ncbi:TetR/AcrR family transcriptional regulator [Nocardia sp. BMG111209]|uniref:TetR/AcrR family transcriptional regulator n=1 Tax=Nocardia sp. BMG111209 TaxID=1160137 RepID=UPI0003649D9D|nr:TetR/AcrR family transcriptional regulator [Nocardia sp. BMG111209]